MAWKSGKIEKSLLRFRSTVTKKPRSLARYRQQALGFVFHPKTFKEIPFVGTQFVQYSMDIEGNSNIDYNVMVRFYDVAFSEKELPRTPVEVNYHKKKFWRSNISLSGNRCAVRCSCQDFRFTWEYELSTKAGSMIGNWRKYDGFPGDPRRNPKHTVGMCKHVWGFLQYLSGTGRVEE